MAVTIALRRPLSTAQEAQECNQSFGCGMRRGRGSETWTANIGFGPLDKPEAVNLYQASSRIDWQIGRSVPPAEFRRQHVDIPRETLRVSLVQRWVLSPCLLRRIYDDLYTFRLLPKITFSSIGK